MKLIILLSVVAFACGACSKKGNDSSPNSSSVSNLDYSKVVCSTVAECSSACDYKYPFVDEAIIDTICESSSTNGNDTCAPLTQMELPGQLQNATCKQLMTTEVIAVESIGGTVCFADSSCNQYCQANYPPAEQPVENAGPIGPYLTNLLNYDLVKVQLSKCLAAPTNYIIPTLD